MDGVVRQVKSKTLNPDWNQTLTFDNKGTRPAPRPPPDFKLRLSRV